jgi:hypothetical protein
MIWLYLLSVIQLPFLVQLLFWMALIPSVNASQCDFPNITFQSFSHFISSTFHPDISLATVLFLVFSLTENTDLLNLHSRQKQQIYPSEKVTQYTGWMIALVNALLGQLDEETTCHLFPNSNAEDILSVKVDAMAQKLKLLPYTKSNQLKSNHVLPISQEKIKPVHLLCPSTFTCTTASERVKNRTEPNKSRDSDGNDSDEESSNEDSHKDSNNGHSDQQIEHHFQETHNITA